MCSNVSKIDIINSDEMTREVFEKIYAYSGRPVLVKNATADNWKAGSTFNFEFFRDLYEDLNSPVLDNKASDCQFFAWDFKEFESLQVSYKKDPWRVL
jgi:hypothetical protein